MTSLLLAALVLPPGGAGPGGGRPDAPPRFIERLPERQQLSYALGVNVGRSLLEDGLDPDPQLFVDGLRDALTEEPVRLSEERLAALLNAAAGRVRRVELAAAQRRAAASRAALRAMGQEPGVETRSTGEVVRFEMTGEGPKPDPGDVVSLHYQATVAGEDEPFFTTRRPRDFGGKAPEVRPATIALGKLLPGLQTVLPDVPVGSTATIGLPPDRAYGAAGDPGVPPDAALFVTVELLGVSATPAPPAERPDPPDDADSLDDADGAGGTAP